MEKSVRPFTARLSTPVRPIDVRNFADGDHVIMHWEGRATARDGGATATGTHGSCACKTERRSKRGLSSISRPMTMYCVVFRRRRTSYGNSSVCGHAGNGRRQHPPRVVAERPLRRSARPTASAYQGRSKSPERTSSTGTIPGSRPTATLWTRTPSITGG